MLKEYRTILMKKVPKSSKIYNCNICDYSSSRKSQYERHLSTNKHKKLQSFNTSSQDLTHYKENYKYICELCSKIYKSREGLWYHKKKCNTDMIENIIQDSQPQQINYSNDINQLTHIVTNLVHLNTNLQNQISELTKSGITEIKNSYNNKTNNTKHFILLYLEIYIYPLIFLSKIF